MEAKDLIDVAESVAMTSAIKPIGGTTVIFGDDGFFRINESPLGCGAIVSTNLQPEPYTGKLEEAVDELIVPESVKRLGIGSQDVFDHLWATGKFREDRRTYSRDERKYITF